MFCIWHLGSIHDFYSLLGMVEVIALGWSFGFHCYFSNREVMLQKGDSLTNKLTSLRDATKMSLSYPGTAVPAGILQFWSLELVLWAPFVLCPMPSLLLMQGSKREEENENERGTQTCWEIRLKVSQQPTMIQCCFWIFPAAGVWSKTSRESSLSRK